MPRDELEDNYAAKFCMGLGAAAITFRIALGTSIINARLGLTDEELM